MTKENNWTADQYFTFKLADEVYGIDISRVREVLEYTKVTRIPKTPDYMKGVINLRGGVVPVVCLRSKFGMEKQKISVETCIIIVEVEIDGERSMLGALADSVQEVINLSGDQIELPPKIGSGINTDYISGMGKIGDNFIILLDIENIFTVEEINGIKGAVRSAPV